MHIIVMSYEFSQDYDIALVSRSLLPYTHDEFIAAVQKYLDDCEIETTVQNGWTSEDGNTYVTISDDVIHISDESDGFGGSKSTIFKILEV